MSYFSNNKYSDFEINLFVSYLIVCIVLSIKPYHRLTWLVENFTVWICLIPLFYIRITKYRFSNIALFIIFIASILHTIGGYFTFQHVPGGEYIYFLGQCGRNNFDRLGHLLCGLLTYPFLEFIVARKIILSRKIASIFSVLCIMGIAALYELIEWLDFIVAEIRFSELFLATQGDSWDAQADMFMCLIGSIIAICIFLRVSSKLNASSFHSSAWRV